MSAYIASFDQATGRPRRRDPHLKVSDVCEELGIARSTFYDWRVKGRAPKCIKLPNGDLRIRRAEYERWLAEREDEPA